jgi:muramoyltetrapeptide carboxypeptidase LdcA involved in peptidoglycan recycling
MKKPEKLKKGDSVAIVSLSSGIAGDELFSHRYELGKKRLEDEFGLKVVTMPNALIGSSKIYNHPELRAEDLMEAFKRKDIKAIFCNLGGDDTIRILPYIDFETLKNNPKIFVGYSDTTINHFMLYKAEIVSYYGPSIMAEFAENVKMHDYTKNSVLKTLFENSKGYKILSSEEWTSESLTWTNPKNNNIQRKMIKEDKHIEILQGSKDVEGILIGGCIDTFHMFIGSNIWPKTNWKNKILFLESSEDKPNPSFISQILRNPLMTEVLSQIKGLIIGKPVDETYYEEYKNLYLEVIQQELKLKELFVGYNYNFGHTAPMCVLPIGIKVRISAEDGSIEFLESATKEEKNGK